MSIFSTIKKSHAQAQDLKAKQAAKKKQEEARTRTPYRHVPTHAASDALLSAPPGWREEDRSRVVELNHRRSVLAHAGHNMNIPGHPAASLPRVNSGLSYIAYPNGSDVPPVPSHAGHPTTRHQMPTRAYSYAAAPSPYLDQPRDAASPFATPLGSVPDLSFAHGTNPNPNSKGKEVATAGGHPRRSSRTSSKADLNLNPFAASEGSTTSEDMEMKPPRSITHRLHPSAPRRASDASVDRYLTAASPRGAAAANPTSPLSTTSPAAYGDTRPPPSTRGFGSIPAGAMAHPLPTGTMPGTMQSPSAPWQPDMFPSLMTSRTSSYARPSAHSSVASIDAVSPIQRERTNSDYAFSAEPVSPSSAATPIGPIAAAEPYTGRLAAPRSPRFIEMDGHEAGRPDFGKGPVSRIESIYASPRLAESSYETIEMTPPAKSKARKLVKKLRK